MEFLKAREILLSEWMVDIVSLVKKLIRQTSIPGMTVSQLINFFSSTAYNASQACRSRRNNEVYD